MINSIINHRDQVAKLAQLVEIRNGKRMLAIDVNRYGISAPFSDCENSTIYRSTIFQLSIDTILDESYENHSHYPNAPYGSIFDY